jgi:hypothetical protein
MSEHVLRDTIATNNYFEVDAEAMIDTPGSLAKDDMSTSMDPQNPMTMISAPPQASP